MTIGEALRQARHRAGLSVAQVSQKTRIREAIIRDIERDDYSSCGGDFYARGHIRAMARATGADSEVLIRQYDAVRSGAVPLATGPPPAAGKPATPEEFGPDGFAAPEEFGPGGFAPDFRETSAFAEPREGGIAASEELGARSEFAAREEIEAPEEITAPHRAVTTSQMATFDDMMASRSAAAPERTPPPRSRQARPAPARRPGGPDRIVVAAVALALAIFGGLAYLLVAGTGGASQAGAAAATGRAAQHEPTSGGQPQGATNSPAASPRSSAPAAPSRSASAATLTPVRAVAFGPGGRGHGDNPQNASRAIDRRPRTAWQSDWYTTSHFGNLKAGTGLLLDMGHRVTITSARIRLGAMGGADLQLRVGGSATLAGLRPVASRAHARGEVRLRLARPAHARYVLIWFTQLPLDPAGTYQAKVYNVRLR